MLRTLSPPRYAMFGALTPIIFIAYLVADTSQIARLENERRANDETADHFGAPVR